MRLGGLMRVRKYLRPANFPVTPANLDIFPTYPLGHPWEPIASTGGRAINKMWWNKCWLVWDGVSLATAMQLTPEQWPSQAGTQRE